MNKILAAAFCLAFSLSIPIPVEAGGAPPALASADWSVNGAHNLASKPPSLDAVQDFYDRAFGIDEPYVKVCEFGFGDLRNSGNLSLIVSINPEGRQWPECNELYIFDRTPTGFELYQTDSAIGLDLAKSVIDINHDGRHELVLWGDPATFATGYYNSRRTNELTCDAEWPLIFAWTGNGYSEVSDQYKDYYRKYLKSLDAQLAAYSRESGPAAAQTANAAPAVDSVLTGRPAIAFENGPRVKGPAAESGVVLSGLAPAPEAAPTPDWQARRQAQLDYPCKRIEAAKAEAFLGINSTSTMSAAIRDSESKDPNNRILAAAIFSFFGGQEAKEDLKKLSNDADPRVARIAKAAASMGENPPQSYRTIMPGEASFRW
jgi:hypothetical protein